MEFGIEGITFEHFHVFMTDLAALIMGIGVFIGAISSIINGFTIRRHARQTANMHVENRAYLEFLAERAIQRRTTDIATLES